MLALTTLILSGIPVESKAFKKEYIVGDKLIGKKSNKLLKTSEYFNL